MFSDSLIARFPASVREAITDLVAATQMEWSDFTAYIQGAYDTSNTPEEFLAQLRGEDREACRAHRAAD